MTTTLATQYEDADVGTLFDLGLQNIEKMRGSLKRVVVGIIHESTGAILNKHRGSMEHHRFWTETENSYWRLTLSGPKTEIKIELRYIADDGSEHLVFRVHVGVGGGYVEPPLELVEEMFKHKASLVIGVAKKYSEISSQLSVIFQAASVKL